jgi:uncharacterized protein with ACT and thioredoxin-like domain
MKQRAVTEVLTVENVHTVDIRRQMEVVYGQKCVLIGTVRRWAACVRDGKHEQVSLNLSDNGT